MAPDLPEDHLIVSTMRGPGDKDVFIVAKALGAEITV